MLADREGDDFCIARSEAVVAAARQRLGVRCGVEVVRGADRDAAPLLPDRRAASRLIAGIGARTADRNTRRRNEYGLLSIGAALVLRPVRSSAGAPSRLMAM
jgi:hypothetical protein